MLGGKDSSKDTNTATKTAATTTYLSYLEKQIEKANTAYLAVDTMREQISKTNERIDIVELQQAEIE